MPAVIRGRCVGAESKVGVPFLIVSVDGLTTTTSVAGDFEIQVVPRAAPYSLRIRSPVHKPVTLSLNITEERLYDLGIVEMVTAIFGYGELPR